MIKLSFIVIGYNEGWKLSKCIRSIIYTTSYNSLINFEIIYVDSNSTDDSIERVKDFGLVRIFKLTGDVNAAIARNVGATEAKGDVFIFIDGDMVLNKKTLLELFDKKKLKYEFVSGDFKNIYYKDVGLKKSLSEEMYYNNKRTLVQYTSGGLFAINRNTWFSVGGMRDIFRRSQDMDLGLRLSKKGIYLHRLPIYLANHHTVSYGDKKRMWSQLVDSTHLYGRSLLYRKNILNFNALKLMIKQDYSLIILMLAILSILLFKIPELILIYFMVVFVRSIFKKNILFLIYYLFRDIKVLIGFFLFHPAKTRVSYISIK